MSGRSVEDLVEAIRQAGIQDPAVLDAVRAVPRAGFVPPDQADRAYSDAPVPIPHGQVTTQPSLSARMVEALRLTGAERVLEVGTGYGYQTALLARLAASVTSIERWPDLAAQARKNLARHGVRNVHVLTGDGTEGVPEHAQYDAVLVSRSLPRGAQPARRAAACGRLAGPADRRWWQRGRGSLRAHY